MSAPFRAATTADYIAAYQAGRTTPTAVAKKVLEASKTAAAMDPPMGIFIAQDDDDVMAQARASTKRWERGEPCGPLDGVPVAVKDELDQTGYPTTVGTAFLGEQPAEHDATSVARMRAAGAVLIGKANMQEIGLGITGINPHHGAARNPHDPERITGGSSSGTGAAVASGLCPIGLGADGGGSVRIPAALCGAVGIKPTFGRVSEHGAAPVCWTVAHVGPLAASVRDAALALELMAGPDPADPQTRSQPPLDLSGLDSGVAGLRVGWCQEWIEQAEAPLVAACKEAADRLQAAGAEVVELDSPDIDLVRVLLSVTIGVEMAASQYEHWIQDKKRYGADTRCLLALANEVKAVDYVRVQRFREVIAGQFRDLLKSSDLLITPTTGASARPILPDALASGQSDDLVLEQMTTFTYAANLTGQPALSVPAGYDEDGLPLGVQLMGRHWEEALLLRCGLALEGGFSAREPKVNFNLLGASS